MVSDIGLFDDYEGSTLTEAIIAQARKRVKKGKGCKHKGFAAWNDGKFVSEQCLDACIWAGGELRIS